MTGEVQKTYFVWELYMIDIEINAIELVVVKVRDMNDVLS